MKKAVLTVSIFSMMCLAGCTGTNPVERDWVATGGSKADGIIRLAIEYGELDKPIVSEEQALKVAVEGCEMWGYTSARAFGGVLTQCTGSIGLWTSCSRYIMTKEYQCIE